MKRSTQWYHTTPLSMTRSHSRSVCGVANQRNSRLVCYCFLLLLLLLFLLLLLLFIIIIYYYYYYSSYITTTTTTTTTTIVFIYTPLTQ